MGDHEAMSRVLVPSLVSLSLLALLISGCGPSVVIEADSESVSTSDGTDESETGDGDGDAETSTSDTDPATDEGDGDGDMSGDGDGDSGDGDGDSGDGDGDSGDGDGDTSGDGDGDTSGDGDGDDPCPLGSEGCPCDVGASCDEELECDIDEGLCLPPVCDLLDPDPHQDEGSAIVLEGVECEQSLNLGEFATMEGPQTDWFRYPGDAKGMCDEQPRAMVGADAPMQVCVYIECQSGNDVTSYECGEGVMLDSPEGRPGCCAETAVLMADYDCMGMNEDVDVYLSVSSVEELCENYVLSYGL